MFPLPKPFTCLLESLTHYKQVILLIIFMLMWIIDIEIIKIDIECFLQLK